MHVRTHAHTQYACTQTEPESIMKSESLNNFHLLLRVAIIIILIHDYVLVLLR